MRWIFLCLVVINCVLFLWQWLAPNSASSEPKTVLPSSSTLKNVPKITLLRELEKGALATLASKKKRLRPSSKKRKHSKEPVCTLVGPFERPLKAEYFVEHMAALDIVAKVQEVEIPGDKGYWVYLPPEASRKKALRRLYELQAKGIDSYVIPKGDLTNGISFGMFSRRDLALKRNQQMKKVGYNTKIKEVPRTFKELWAVLKPEEAKKLGVKLWQKVRSDNPKIERRQNFCPSVASADNFH